MTQVLRFPRPITPLLLLVVWASTAAAQETDDRHLWLASSPAVEAGPVASMGGPNLVLDDGGAEDGIGLNDGGSLLWFNRFTPPAGDFPMRLLSVDVLFPLTGNFPVGSVFDVFVWSDADGNPANGATLVGSRTGNTVSVLDAFQTVSLSTPFTISTGGDVLIGLRTTGPAGHFPAAQDQTATQGRSWAGFGAGADVTPPTLPTATFGTIDSFGLPGNWLIRGTYTTEGVATESGPNGVSELRVAPNPVATQGTAVVRVATAQAVRVSLYDALGREVRVLLDRTLSSGQEAHIGFRTDDLPAGVYVVRATGSDVSLVERVAVVR